MRESFDVKGHTVACNTNWQSHLELSAVFIASEWIHHAGNAVYRTFDCIRKLYHHELVRNCGLYDICKVGARKGYVRTRDACSRCTQLQNHLLNDGHLGHP